MGEVRIGIIGTGIIAHEHASRWLSIPGIKLVAACDLQAGKLGTFCDKYDIAHRYVDYRELLARDDLDAVDVCLHNNLHAPMSIAVMASGKDCYCEKPMAGAYTDALAMKRAAEHFGRRLHIQLGMLYGPQVVAAKKFVDAGRLGQIYHARSYGYRRRGRPYVDGYGEKEFVAKHWAGHGALYDMGVYHISQLLYLLGTPKIRTISGQIYQELDMPSAQRTEADFSVEELGTGYVKFDGGLTMDILESWAIHGGPFPPSSLHGAQGGLKLGGAKPDGLTYYSEIEGYPASAEIDLGAQEQYMQRHDPMRKYFDNSQTLWAGILTGEGPYIDTANIALQTMLISEGIFLSSQLGREVCAEEVAQLSQSIAVTRQDAPFGELAYPPYPFY